MKQSNKTQEALKMAIEALENIFGWQRTTIDILDVHKTCKEALAEAKKQEWQSLSDDEMDDLFKKHGVMFLEGNFKFARAIEAKLKEKNHG